MDTPDLNNLADSLEDSKHLTPETSAAIVDVIRRVFPHETEWPKDRDPMIHSTDEIIHIVDEALPDWTIRLTGRTNDADGHWTCTLRKSDALDNDRFIGIGRAPVLSHAILAAMIRLTALRN